MRRKEPQVTAYVPAADEVSKLQAEQRRRVKTWTDESREVPRAAGEAKPRPPDGES
jgi:hypothetical protein